MANMEDFNKERGELERQKTDAEVSMDGAEVGRLEQAIKDLDARKSEYENLAQNATEISPNQLKQVEDLGGDVNTLENKLNENTEEIAQVEEALKEQSEIVVPNGNTEHKVDPELEPEHYEEVVNATEKIEDRTEEFTPESIAKVLGNNILTQNIEETGISSKKYDDEPGKVFVTVAIKEENLKDVVRFLNNNSKDFKWGPKGGNQIILEIENGSEDPQIGLEKWNKELEDRIDHLKNVIKEANEEVGKAMENLKKPGLSPGEVKQWEESRNSWRGHAEAWGRELDEKKRQLEKNKAQAT